MLEAVPQPLAYRVIFIWNPFGLGGSSTVYMAADAKYWKKSSRFDVAVVAWRLIRFASGFLADSGE